MRRLRNQVLARLTGRVAPVQIVKYALTIKGRSAGVVARLPWPHSGRTRTLNAAAYCAPVSTVWAGQQWNEQVAGARGIVYGSEGPWTNDGGNHGKSAAVASYLHGR